MGHGWPKEDGQEDDMNIYISYNILIYNYIYQMIINNMNQVECFIKRYIFFWDVYKVLNMPGELSFEGVITKNSKDRRLNPPIPQYWPGRTHSVFAASIQIILDENHLMSACGGNFCDVEISSAKRSWRHHIILIKIIQPKGRQELPCYCVSDVKYQPWNPAALS